MNDEFVNCYSPICGKPISRDLAKYGEGDRPYCNNECEKQALDIDKSVSSFMSKSAMGTNGNGDLFKKRPIRGLIELDEKHV